MSSQSFVSNYEKGTWMHKLDPRVKLVFIIAFVFIPLLFTDMKFLLVITAILVPVWMSAKIEAKPISALIIAVLVFSIIAVVFATFYNYNVPGQKVLFKLGPLVATNFGFISGLTLGLRSAIPSLVVLILICTTDPAQLAKAMMKLKMPLTVAFMMLAALRMFPMVTEEMGNISTAQTIRGIDKKGFKGAMKAFKLAAFPLMINCLRRSRTMGLAIESKGFGKRSWKEYYQDFSLGKVDWLVLIATLALLAAALYIRYGLGLGMDGKLIP